jgi:hypothetical protein
MLSHDCATDRLFDIIAEIATTMYELEIERDCLDSDKLAMLFQEMIQMCLWSVNRSAFPQIEIQVGNC